MRTPDLSSRQLRAFIALADLRSFTKAAASCHLSQPAFSALIRTLEESLSARLFDRDTRSVQLTPEGALFETSARRLLDDMGDALGDLADHVERRKGRVRVAALPSLAAGWLPSIFAEFAQSWPGISVGLHDALSDACLDMVRAGQVDFALAASAAESSPDLVARRLCSDRFHLVCPAGNPLAHEKRITIEQLAPYPFIHMSRNSSVRQSLEAALHPLRLNSAFEVEHLATVMGLVEAGLGISVIPTLTLFHFRRDSLAVRPLEAPALTRHIYIVRRRAVAISIAAQTMHDLIADRLGDQIFG
ncbi:MAG: LysR family transcriptional regulator [Comamonadaceae bacterium]|nr:MAG: LysR family transcriptional regulator [Comamonadaceae bacterium]